MWWCIAKQNLYDTNKENNIGNELLRISLLAPVQKLVYLLDYLQIQLNCMQKTTNLSLNIVYKTLLINCSKIPVTYVHLYQFTSFPRDSSARHTTLQLVLKPLNYGSVVEHLLIT